MKRKNKLLITLSSLAVLCAATSGLLLGTENTYTANAATEDTSLVTNFTMKKGSSIRMTEANQNGLRFMAQISESDYLALETEGNDVSYGMLIAPIDYVNEHALTVENVFGENAVYDYAVKNDKGEYVYTQSDKTRIINITYDSLQTYEGSYVIRGSLLDLQPQNITREFVGRAYIKKGDTYVMASYAEGNIANNTRSMFDVATDAIADTTSANRPSDSQKAWLQANYLDKALWKISLPDSTSAYSVEAESVWAKNGEEYTFSVTPNDDYVIIVRGGGTVLTGEDNRYTLAQVDGHTTVSIEAYKKVNDIDDFKAIGNSPETLNENYILMNDIDLQGGKLNTLAQAQTKWSFGGIFDGNGHTISNYTGASTQEPTWNNALFGVVSAKGVVRNLNIVNTTIASKIAAAVAVQNEGTIENCFVSATVSMAGHGATNPTGGIVAKNGGTVRNCVAVVEAESGIATANVGGIVGGNIKAVGKVENCYLLSTTLQDKASAATAQGTMNTKVVSTLPELNALSYEDFGDMWETAEGVYPHLNKLTDTIILEKESYMMLANSTINVEANSKYPVYFSLKEEKAGVSVSANGAVAVDDSLMAGDSFIIVVKSYYTTDEKEITVTIREVSYEVSGEVQTLSFDFVQGDTAAATKAHGITVLRDGQPYAGEDVTITSNNTSVARVDGDNVVAVGDGTAMIEVKVLGTVKYTIAVNSVMYRPIRTVADFNAMSTNDTTKSYKYKLMNDIDVQGGTLQTVSHNDTGKNFTGIFDGNGYTISNFSATTDTANKNFNCSLFGNVSGTIRNLNVVNMVINTRFGGGIATLNWGTIENCYVQATFSGEGTKAMAGGIACKNSKIIKNCVAVISYAEGETGTAVQGGIVGQQTNANAVIENCYLLSTDVAMLGSTASVAGSKTTNVQVVKTAEELKALDYTTFGDMWDYTGTYPTLKPKA